MSGAERPTIAATVTAAERRTLSPNAQVWAIVAVMLVTSVAALSVTPDLTSSTRPAEWWTWYAIAAAYGAFEYLVFNLQFRREGIAFSLSEIPTAFALVFLAPLPAISARLVVCVVVLVWARRNTGVKLAFNLALLVLDLSLTILLFRALLGVLGDSDSALIVSIVVSQVIAAPAMGVLIAVVISRYEGGMRMRIVSGIAATWWFYAVNPILAAMVVALALLSPLLSLLAILPLAAMGWVLMSFGKMTQQLRDLDAVHGFAGRVGRSLELDEISEVAVDETLRLMHAESATLVRFRDDGTAEMHTTGDLRVEMPTVADDPRWADLISGDSARVLSPTDLRERGIVIRGPAPTTIVVPVTDGGESFAVLVITGRDNQIHRFDEIDRSRAQNLAEQLASSLRKAVLHERLEFEARHDALTTLPGRTLFERHVSEVIANRELGVMAYVLMLDLDRFKEVNDTLGHHAGDDLLVQFSGRMSGLLGPRDVLARLAGDEFAILCVRSSDDAIVRFAQQVVREGGRPVMLDGLEIVVTVSVGVAKILEVDDDAVQPMRRADIAMYNAKWQRSGVELYRDEIDRRTPARLSMLGDLRAAIESDLLDVVYQPKLDLRTGEIVGVEALVRWDHPNRGVVAPAEFVRVAEDTGLIKQLTDLVLSRGIASIRRLHAAGRRVGLAVNLSTHDLFDGQLPQRVRTYLEANGVSPEYLTLEITESSLFVDAPRTRATIDELHGVGLRMAVDDFGTGYSSLSYLRRLPVHELKIDQSFVARMLDDPQDEVIVRSTIDLGHNLGLGVVAEGVESAAVLEHLRSIGCDIAQGYCISRPLTEEALLDWLARVDRTRHGVSPTSWVGSIA